MATNAAHTTYDARSHTRVDAGTLIRTGAIAGLAGGMMMAMWQMVVGAIAQEPTAVPGIHQSFWTAVTAITSVIFGTDAFHGSFHFWPVAFGLMGHMANSMMLGIVGLGLLRAIFGSRPNPLVGAMFGVAFGLALEAIIVKAVVNNIQDVHTLSTSTPQWSWWVAHVLFGMTVGGLGALLLRRSTDG